MANTQITLKAFMALKNSKGEFKTWGDIKDGGYIEGLKNAEVLGNVYRAPTSITGENITYEYQVFPVGQDWDNTAAAEKPVLNRVALLMPNKRKQFNYTMDLFGVREAVEWSKYLTETDGRIHTQIANANNLIAIEAIKDYCLATGQFKILDKIKNPASSQNEIFTETAKIADLADGIMSTQTMVNLGLDAERLSILLSPFAMRQITTGLAGMNVSQGAFDAVKLGRINNLFGYNFDKSIYLQKPFNETVLKGSNFDFTKILGIVYNLDSLAFYQQEALWTNTPVNQGEVIRAVGWKPLAVMLPSQEHTSYVLLSTAPSLAEVNAARAKLLLAQPMAYAKLPGGAANVITQSEYNAMITKASDFGSMVAPNVEKTA